MINQIDPLLQNEANNPDLLLISAALPNGTRKTYHFDQTTKVSDLIDSIKDDDTITKPPDKTIAILYHGRFLKPYEKFSEIDTLKDYTVSVLFKTNPNPNANIEIHELKGFDRLVRMNYTSEQIQEIRNHFHQMRGGQNDTPEQKIDAEEEWLPVIFNCDNPLQAFQNYDFQNNNNNTPNHNNANFDNELIPGNNTVEGQIERQIELLNQNFHHNFNRNEIQNLALDQILDRRNFPTNVNIYGSVFGSFALSFVLGLIFGLPSLLYGLFSYSDSNILYGILFGIVFHYFFVYILKFFGI